MEGIVIKSNDKVKNLDGKLSVAKKQTKRKESELVAQLAELEEKVLNYSKQAQQKEMDSVDSDSDGEETSLTTNGRRNGMNMDNAPANSTCVLFGWSAF